ncbi:hypothetical protein RFN25_29865 [Mesorhizobium abyssinicae]|uniref:Uncharacterized protein n=1 Tax=Mesorhizobium abyssinicae TaxID=1209958 RepID=A0ABU5AWZ2_9HYPH|nr:hypothetical protein [Mesorhizobium abyssinicae]MDX8437616.1 hypothetical protein [Mesorhizobium abyssinicae]MDX8541827.1 hypothetical protein [Mesorhizobium abyssinicae]
MNTHIKEAERKRLPPQSAFGRTKVMPPATIQCTINMAAVSKPTAPGPSIMFFPVPARFGGDAMTGLSCLEATSGMLRLNLRNAERRRERIELSSLKTVAKPAECGS